MSIVISRERCTGCSACTKVCPGSLIEKDSEGKAYIRYPRDCWGCASCIKECRFGAIALYLGADIGGRGSKMTVLDSKDTMCWSVQKADGVTEQIVIDKKESNQY